MRNEISGVLKRSVDPVNSDACPACPVGGNDRTRVVRNSLLRFIGEHIGVKCDEGAYFYREGRYFTGGNW